ncbi:MAG: hypothetical protein PHW40_01740 [Candidatus Izemoplasmatales bacterium]|nr:hypothetical protein [Candidatus Izemoplasmatales bacterium]MDD5293018.1 hypothetical protein [Candidatus Izemoplasmatales bacterium]
MCKKILMIFGLLATVLVLGGCWPAEIGVETEFTSRSGGGTRVFVVDIMDDTLATEPITNPDDPDGTEGKGAVINNKHITGGLGAIQTWLEQYAPDFITVKPMTTSGYHRYFTFEFSFKDFDEFLEKYEALVNLSPTMSWSDFDADEKPKWVCEGGQCTFTESKAILEASLDWALDGIFNDIYDADDLADYVGKADISVLANYKLYVGDGEYEELQHFDADAIDGAGTGKVVYVTSETLTGTGQVPMAGWLIGVIIAGVVLVAGGAVVLVLLLGKKKAVA